MAKKYMDMLGTGGMQAYALHPQANGTIERWSRTRIRDLACLIATGDSDWGKHVTVACFRYIRGLRAVPAMTSFKAVSWGESVPSME